MQPYPGDITNVHGIRVGQMENESARTGVTVVLGPREGAIAGVSVRGAAPGTRETDVLRPGNLVEQAHAVVLSGGSAFGLAAADGVMRFLAQSGIGIDMGIARVPIVPAAVLFDLGVGDANVTPDAAMGRAAVTAAAKGVQQGPHGAGCGCTIGKLVQNTIPVRGGIGSASMMLQEGITIGAIVAVNAVGDVYHPDSGQCIACARTQDGTPVKADGLLYGSSPMPMQVRIPAPGTNTTIGVVAVDCKLTKDQATRLADVAHGGLARAIRPSHTQMDGDTMFALATERVMREVNFVKLCAAAQEVTARAVINAVLYSNK
ncbi:MAG: P1 family peptidase [Christensenellales bacterium]|jgi:L-aminopeptidase/D-esterase-like protein|nr:P1 family peptidase [Clostridiales bacterium]